MAKLVLKWQINRFLQAREAADSVPTNVRELLEQPGIHTSHRVFVLEKIAGLIEAGADSVSIVTSANVSIADDLRDSSLPATVPSSARPNQILLADSTDAVVREQPPPPHCWSAISLTIGFLNGQLEKLPEFLPVFDIVVADEQDMNLSSKIVEEIVAAKKNRTFQ